MAAALARLDGSGRGRSPAEPSAAVPGAPAVGTRRWVGQVGVDLCARRGVGCARCRLGRARCGSRGSSSGCGGGKVARCWPCRCRPSSAIHSRVWSTWQRRLMQPGQRQRPVSSRAAWRRAAVRALPVNRRARRPRSVDPRLSATDHDAVYVADEGGGDGVGRIEGVRRGWVAAPVTGSGRRRPRLDGFIGDHGRAVGLRTRGLVDDDVDHGGRAGAASVGRRRRRRSPPRRRRGVGVAACEVARAGVVAEPGPQAAQSASNRLSRIAFNTSAIWGARAAPNRAPEVHGAVDVGDRGLAGVVDLVVVVVGTVGIGEAFPVPGGATERLERQLSSRTRNRVSATIGEELITATGVGVEPGQARTGPPPTPRSPTPRRTRAVAVTRRAVRSRWVTSALDNPHIRRLRPATHRYMPVLGVHAVPDPPSRSTATAAASRARMACSISASRASQGAAVQVGQPLTQRRDIDRTHVPSMTRGCHNERRSWVDHGGGIDTVRRVRGRFGWNVSPAALNGLGSPTRRLDAQTIEGVVAPDAAGSRHRPSGSQSGRPRPISPTGRRSSAATQPCSHSSKRGGLGVTGEQVAHPELTAPVADRAERVGAAVGERHDAAPAVRRLVDCPDRGQRPVPHRRRPRLVLWHRPGL